MDRRWCEWLSTSNLAVVAKHTAERLLDAAEAVFAERGYDAASLGDVADRVGIRPQAIYNHFSGKRELYAAVLERLLDPFLTLLDDAASARGGAQVAEALTRDIAFHARNPWIMERFGKAGREGRAYVRSEMRYALEHAPAAIPGLLLRDAIKLLGMHLGRREALLPRSLKRRLSMNPRFWDDEPA